MSLVQKGQTRVHRGCSTQWNSGIWWLGHCLWCKKVKPEYAMDAVHSGIVVYGGGDIVFGAKRSNQWMQYAVCSGIVVYGGRDIVLWGKKVKPVDTVCSMQWNSGIWWWGHCSLVQKGQTSGCSMQWTQWNSDIWWWGHCLWGKKVKPVDAVTQCTVSTV